MKDLYKTIKESLILLFGTGLFTYGLFSFDNGGSRTLIQNEMLLIKGYSITTYYYYNDTSLILLIIGAIFIVIGLLKIRKKRIEH